jgi:hypothetical protein
MARTTRVTVEVKIDVAAIVRWLALAAVLLI